MKGINGIIGGVSGLFGAASPNQKTLLNLCSNASLNNNKSSSKQPKEEEQELELDDDIASNLDTNNDGKITKQEVNAYNNKEENVKKDDNSDKVTTTTTTKDYDSKINHVPDIPELQDIPFETDLFSIEDSKEIRFGIGANAPVYMLDDTTQEVLDDLLQDKKIVSCKDGYSDSWVSRTMKLDDNSEIHVNINAWGQTNIEIHEYSGDANNPQNNDKITIDEYIKLSDGSYAIVSRDVWSYQSEMVNPDGSKGAYFSPASKISCGYGGKIYEFIAKIYDKNGNEIKLEKNKEEYDKLYSEIEKHYSGFYYG